MPFFPPPASHIVPVQYVVPTTGQTVVIRSSMGQLILNPAGLLATLTVSMPPNPQNGQLVSISSTKAITAFTLNGGTIIGAITTLALAGFAYYVYSSNTLSWLRAG